MTAIRDREDPGMTDPEVLLDDMTEVIRGQIGDHPDAMSDTATAAAILEHLDSLALIRWPWDASCRDLHRYRDSPGGLMCMRRRGHDGAHRQGSSEW